MSDVKGLLMQQLEGLFTPTDASICLAHIEDRFLRRYLPGARATEPCAICGRLRKATGLDDVLAFGVEMIRLYRGRALDDLSYDSEEEYGFAFTYAVSHTWDIVPALFEGGLDDDLLQLMQERLEPDIWYERSMIWLEGKELYLYSWRQFAEAMRTGVTPERDDWATEAAEGISVEEMLERLASLIDEFDLVHPSSRARWIRAVRVPKSDALDAARLGTAPPEHAMDGRMSCRGEGIFYGAADEQTSLLEIRAVAEESEIVVGEWRPRRPLHLLDLTRLPTLPSFYDLERKYQRDMLTFLEAFATDVSLPVDVPTLGGYRPTQAISAHLRQSFEGLDGIVYSSSITGKACCALFVSNKECGDETGPLEFRKFHRRRSVRGA
jgi:hypothetical protein